MSGADGPNFGLVGALEAIPRRLAARAVEAAGGTLQRGVTRRTTHVVFGRSLLRRCDEDTIAERLAQAGEGRARLGETAFLSLFGLVERTRVPASAGLSREDMVAKSGLAAADFDALVLFDAFEQAQEPFDLRNLILARKYAGLIASGASWVAIARSVHHAGPRGTLAARSLHIGPDRRVYAREGEGLCELDGQFLLELGGESEGPDDLFIAAQAAEDDGDPEEAAALYGRCLVLDPADATAAFNRANCLRETGQTREAEIEYLRALRHDPDFLEARFNLAALMREAGRTQSALRHLEEAIARDPSYGDAVYNRATLAFETGDLESARHWWARYLEIDPGSEWARQAERGLAYLARMPRHSA